MLGRSFFVGHEFLNYDDPIYNAEPHVRVGLSLSGIVWAFKSGYTENAFPLTWISHMLDWQLFGGASGPHHLVSVLLHAISSLVLFAFLKRITGSAGKSAFVAFVFALHPLHVESVAWITERKDVLCALFWMLTLLAYARYSERPSLAKYAITVALFCCGLLSKPMMISFPFVALLLDWWPMRRFATQPARRRNIARCCARILSSARLAAAWKRLWAKPPDNVHLRCGFGAVPD
jgi:hypothetical protein